MLEKARKYAAGKLIDHAEHPIRGAFWDFVLTMLYVGV